MKVIRAIKIFTVNAFIFTSFLSCNAQNKNPIEATGLRECINETVNKYAKESYGKAPFDFYSFIQELEHQLITYKLINNPEKDSYLGLFSKLESEKNDIYEGFYNKAIKLMRDKGFDFNLKNSPRLASGCRKEMFEKRMVFHKILSFSSVEYLVGLPRGLFIIYGINNAIFSKCPYDILTKLEDYEKTPYYGYAVLLDKIMNHGYNNQEIIKELLESVDETKFSKLHYRAPIILLAIINIDLKFNPIEPMEKFEVEGKTYFRPKKRE